jgi:release factor H-coupled RctB family protein
MGNSSAAIAPHLGDGARKRPSLTNFYGDSAWIEGRAQSQINDVLSIEGVTRVAAFPDLHPGRYGPVGVAVESSRLHPLLVGNDIGCGMSVFELDLPVRKIKVDKAADRLRLLEGDWDGNPEDRLAEIGLDPSTFPTSIGSIGGGNHFCELQMVHEKMMDGIVDPARAYLLVHSGSRAFGESVLSSVPHGSGLAVDADTEVALDYLAKHDAAVKWASLNREIIAERAAEALRADVRLVCDVPHNLVVRSGTRLIHYKGAACVGSSSIAPVAGSRETLSHIVLSSNDMEASLGGISHGAGRKYDRASMHHRVGRSRSDREAMERTQWGGRIICEDRDLLLEEAGEAYKDAGRVVSDLVAFDLVSHVAAMRPLVTFKRAREEKPAVRERAKGRGRR